ncbi:MAG: exodeoxyribonuclease III [Rhizobiales bacterium]|nr:exodeoxyribonuclease III [Hyphomicrobiales bacterium]
MSIAMKIASFNINNVRRRLPNLLDWLNRAKPDVACLQELKSADAEFPADALRQIGYEAIWRGEKTWNGVAILARGVMPVVTRTELPGDPDDRQSRYIEAAVNGILIASLYAPNGNPQPGPKFDYKLAWFRRLTRHAATLNKASIPVVLAGDYNVVPTAQDIYPTTSYDDDALLQPQSRAAYKRLLAQGWIDAIRVLHPDAPMYTFWDYKRKRWERDAGMRLDQVLLTPDLHARLVDAGVDRTERGEANASDHVPVWVVLRDAARQRAKPTRGASTAPQPPKPAPRVQRSKPAATAKERRPLLVIDGDSFAHRAYHALPKNIMRAGRKSAGAILGFANYLLRFYQTEQPRAVLVGWDTLTAETYRHESFPDYQGGREFDDALIEQLDILPTLVAACGFANAKKAGYEADDFLAAAAAREERRGGITLVASGDRDTFQLASDATTILYPVRAGEIARITPADVRTRYGVDPAQVPDFIALRGDPSDRLPGAKNVGAQGAADVLRRHGSLEGALAAGRFAAQAKELRLYRSIATMDRKAPLPPLPDETPSWSKASALARTWQLNQLADRLAAMSEAQSRQAVRG